MYVVSEQYKEQIKEKERQFKISLQIQHSQGILNLEESDLIIGSVNLIEETQSGEEFTVGEVVASEFNLTLVNKAEYAGIDFEGAIIRPYSSLLLSNAQTENNYFYGAHPQVFTDAAGDLYETVPLGVFNVDEPLPLKNTIQLKALDNMVKFDKSYSLSALSYPATLYQIYVNACNVCDVTVGTMSFPNKDHLVNERPEGEYTFRDILGFVAELAGCFAKCNRVGACEVRWYEETGLVLTGANRENFKPKDYQVGIKGVMADIDEDTAYIAGVEDYVVDLSENPLLQSNYDIMLPAILAQVEGTIFYPYESSWQGDPSVEAGDIITHIGIDGRTYKTIITSSIYKYKGKGVISAKGLSPKADKGYKGSMGKQLSTIKRKVEKEIGDKLTTLEQAQINATELMTNMLGGHIIEDKENGIIYIADNPDLELANKIWKWGPGGFGYSEDGGQTYGTAITADGSIVASLIAAGIITADNVQTGMLQSEDGSTWFNLNTGDFNLKNKIKYVDGVYTLTMKDGTPIDDAIAELPIHNIILGNENQSFATNSLGATTTQIVITSPITTLKGAHRIDSTIGTLVIKNSIGTTIAPAGVALTKANPTLTVDGHVTMTINSSINLVSDSGWIEIPIQIEGINYTKKISWSKAKAGAPGEIGETGATGAGLNILGSLGSSGELPVTGTSGDAYLINGDLWTWDGAAWANVGNIQGPIGPDGPPGADGGAGVQGPPGQDGTSTYFHVRYSQSIDGSNMTPGATGALYMGTCVTTNPTGPTEPSAYTWALIKGLDGVPGVDGDDGIEGPPGTDGQTSYLHIKYSNDGLNFSANNGETPAAWVGTLVNFTQLDSTVFADYTWKKIEGEAAKIVNILPSATYFVTDSVGQTAADYVYTPNSIVLTPDMQNCIFDKWQYSLNGSSWTNVVIGQNGLTIDVNTKALTVLNNSLLYNTQAYVLFRVLSTTAEYDLITLPRIYNNINLATRVSSVEQEVTADSIMAKVETKVAQGGSSLAQKSEIVQTAQSWVARFGTMQNLKIRYIRDWQNGSVESPTFSYWNELQVLNAAGANIAIASGTVTASSAENVTYPISRWRDGSISTYARVTGTGWQYLQWDLGVATLDIRAIGIKHYLTGRKYNHRLEVSEDGINWVTLYNSGVDGYYLEEATPRMYYINQFKQGIVTINGEKIRIEHSGSNQYSEMRADGFVRKWPYGEAAYLNDIYVATYDFSTGDSYDYEPPANRITLPQSFRGRGSTTKIVLALNGLSETQIGYSYKGVIEWFPTWFEIIIRVANSDFNAVNPWLDIEAYSLIAGENIPSGVDADDYRRIAFTLIAIGY